MLFLNFFLTLSFPLPGTFNSLTPEIRRCFFLLFQKLFLLSFTLFGLFNSLLLKTGSGIFPFIFDGLLLLQLLFFSGRQSRNLFFSTGLGAFFFWLVRRAFSGYGS